MEKPKTTIIGSYPVKIDVMELMNNYFSQTDISWKKYIDTAVKDLIDIGIEIISDGQTRDPFVNIFTRKLKGCRIRSRTEIIDKIEYDNPITIEDLKYVKKIIPKDIKLIGLITGPYTLTKSCVDLYYNNEEKIAFDFAYALSCEAKLMQNIVDIISIDEPFFSIVVPKYGKDIIGIITDSISCPIRLHSCGDVSKVVSELLDMPVDILSHEFKATPKLFDSFSEFNITKKICLGSVRSDNTKIEPVDEIVDHIRRGIEIFGNKIVQLGPDCGLRLLPRDIAFQKLKNLVKARNKVYGG